MRQDEIDAIKDYNDPNSCYRPSDEPLYKITQYDGTELLHQTRDDVIDYVRDELVSTLFRFRIFNADDDDEAFEKAKEYLEQFSAIEKE